MVKLSDEMGEHTPEPWSFNGWMLKANENDILLVGVRIPMTHGQGQDTARANARRIVACVNACRGIETGVLEEAELGPELASARGRATIAESNESKATERADDAEALLLALADAIQGVSDKSRGNIVKCCKDARTFLAKTAPEPVKPGDEGEG